MKKILLIISLVLIILLGFSTELFSNIYYSIIGNSYIIPDESNIFFFKVTKMNEGSGDYWLYGKDKNYYYSSMKNSDNIPYIKISKAESEKIKSERSNYFNEINYKTWDLKYLCGDLLEIYAKKPDNLEFVECEIIDGAQTLVRATYRVSGKKSKEVEDFLVGNYNMKELEWSDFSGWVNKGIWGIFEHKDLCEIDKFLSGAVIMYQKIELGTKREYDRDKIEYFEIIVELSII
ncbi:DUF4952 domain-containing protein [Fusobacterium sp. PH5-44]|uniref:DUF4952 domain-containing protein n=1 Tax=unclassified Fusobacterium TaxID=2648384 RepID=UPI003D2456FB